MAEGKKSFIIYSDSQSLVNKLPNEVAGELFKMLFSYVNDENPTTENPLTDIAFEHFRQKLKKDLVKWNETRKVRSKAGKASAEARKQKATNPTRVKSVENKSTNPTVSVNDNVSVSVSDSVSTNVDDENPVDDKNSLITIERCKEKYLSNEKIKQAVSKNPENKIEYSEIEGRIKMFNRHLIETGDMVKSFNDYCKHFRDWHKKNRKANVKSTQRQFL